MDEPEVKQDDRTPANVAMKLLQVASDVDFAIAIYEGKDESEDIDFVVEWAGEMSRYEVIGILSRAMHLLSEPTGSGDDEDSEGGGCSE
jgi:hypothetical protein